MTVSISTGINLALQLIQTASQISNVVQAAQAVGRDTLTQEEWAGIRRLDDAARADLVAAIGEKLAPPPPPEPPQEPAAPGSQDPLPEVGQGDDHEPNDG